MGALLRTVQPIPAAVAAAEAARTLPVPAALVGAEGFCAGVAGGAVIAIHQAGACPQGLCVHAPAAWAVDGVIRAAPNRRHPLKGLALEVREQPLTGACQQAPLPGWWGARGRARGRRDAAEGGAVAVAGGGVLITYPQAPECVGPPQYTGTAWEVGAGGRGGGVWNQHNPDIVSKQQYGRRVCGGSGGQLVLAAQQDMACQLLHAHWHWRRTQLHCSCRRRKEGVGAPHLEYVKPGAAQSLSRSSSLRWLAGGPALLLR